MSRAEAVQKQNVVVDILMKRDGISKEEAMAQISECADALMDGEYDAIEYYLGLEDDYIYDIIDFIWTA